MFELSWNLPCSLFKKDCWNDEWLLKLRELYHKKVAHDQIFIIFLKFPLINYELLTISCQNITVIRNFLFYFGYLKKFQFSAWIILGKFDIRFVKFLLSDKTDKVEILWKKNVLSRVVRIPLWFFFLKKRVTYMIDSWNFFVLKENREFKTDIFFINKL